MPRGIPIRNPRDRGAEILADPDGYYRRAREDARRVVERDAALRGVLEITALLVLAAVGLVVFAFAVQACAT